jgi:hypothetical protein
MKMTIEMSTISVCAATACAYNVEQACHARAITIGEGVHPSCDTYVEAGRHVEAHSTPAGVGACKVDICRFNRDFECEAAAIEVDCHSLHADCVTFERR